MAKATIVNVDLLINETGDGEIADAVSGILTEQMRCYAGNHSSLVDWAHTHRLREVEIDDDYMPDESASPWEAPGPDATTILRELVEWQAYMGGFESPVWDRAKALLAGEA